MHKEDDAQFVEDDLTELIAMIEDPRKAPRRLQSSSLKEHAHKSVITKRADVERSKKHVTVKTDHHTLVIEVERSYSNDAPISITTTQVDELTYVVLAGDRFNSMNNEASRFIFNNNDLAENFKNDLILAITSSNFVKSDHLISPYDTESEILNASLTEADSRREKAKAWLNFVIYGLTTCGIVLVGATAVGYGWKLANNLL